MDGRIKVHFRLDRDAPPIRILFHRDVLRCALDIPTIPEFDPSDPESIDAVLIDLEPLQKSQAVDRVAAFLEPREVFEWLFRIKGIPECPIKVFQSLLQGLGVA